MSFFIGKKEAKMIFGLIWNGLWEKIGEVIGSKNGKWDRGLDGKSQELTQMLIYEYATSLEDITRGKLPAEFVLDKLARTLGTLRLGDFKEGQDDNIKYKEITDNKKDTKIITKF